ncbi:P-loop containing nucleoside triphosphate hydrolase protein [Lactarius deliciosus]|nr:P-loop containing nucleoside triphosphate hydrolase protein [Lactarius deliciosus]
MAPGAEPLSIESLLQKQKEEREAAARPIVISSSLHSPSFYRGRNARSIAIAKRAQEIQEEKRKEEDNRKNREELEREAESIRRRERDTKYTTSNSATRYGDHHDRDRNRDRDRGRGTGRRDHRDRRMNDDRRSGYNNVPTEPRAERAKASANPATPTSGGPQSVSASSSSTPAPDSTFTPSMTEDDLAALRSRYLGVDKKKRKIRKMNDRKFVFDWDEQEDTGTADPSANIGVQRQGAQVMFGRGHIASMDDGGGSRAGTKPDAQLADAMERRKAAKHGYDDRHWTDKALDEMKERDWRIFREDFSIAARGGNIPHPLRSWSESTIPKQILAVIDQIGYKEPSPIQRQAIPIGLQNRDIIGIAETGSGKTAAFVIPMLTFISNMPPFTEENRHLGPYGLILAPTRELAQQIESEAKKFAAPLGFHCVSIVGGEIIIATPGRLKDVLERHVLVLSQCRYVVMDEADRMVHLGFEADLTFILDKLPSETMEGEDQSEQMDVDGETLVKKGRTRVTTLFSATMPPPVERLARKYPETTCGRAVDTVEQRVEFVIGDEKKKQRLLEILNSGEYQAPIIVFVNQKKTADMVAKDLSRAGWSAATLHSGKNQEQREASLQSLRSGAADVLVATDLAGRGIDVQDVSLVINFQMAGTIEAYVHRIGRTGRAGKQGIAITFLTNDDDEVMYDLKQEISKSPVSKVPVELARHEAAQHKVSREMKRKRDAEDQG